MLNVINEPESPQAAKRMTIQEKLWLTAQRKLNDALEQDAKGIDAEDQIVENLIELGQFQTALDAANKPENHRKAADLVAAEHRTKCRCKPIAAQLKEGAKTVDITIPNYSSVKEYPQRTLWYCSKCKKSHLSSDVPDEITRQALNARTALPGKGHGPDYQVLKNAPKTE